MLSADYQTAAENKAPVLNRSLFKVNILSVLLKLYILV